MRTLLKLVYKDIRAGAAGNGWRFILWFLFVIVVTPPLFAAGFMSAVFISMVIALDEKARIDTLYCSFPLKRSTYVLSKYLFTFAVLFIFLLLALLIRLQLSLLFTQVPFRGITLQGLFYLLFPLTILFSIFYPVHFKMGGGVEKSASFFVVVILLGLAVGAFGVLVLISIDSDIFKIEYIYLYLSTIMIVFVGVSLLLSIKFFSKRELS